MMTSSISSTDGARNNLGGELLEPIAAMTNSEMAGLSYIRYVHPTGSRANAWPDPSLGTKAERMTRETPIHPLVRFYIAPGILKVLDPSEVCGGRTRWQATPEFAITRDQFGIGEVLGIPVLLRDATFCLLTVGRCGRPYGMRERETAEWLQLILQLLALQSRPATPSAAMMNLFRGVPTPAPSDALTPRERDVLDQMASGCTRSAAARQLAISPRTLDRHLDNIYRKLGVSSLVAAITTSMAPHSPANDAGAHARHSAANEGRRGGVSD